MGWCFALALAGAVGGAWWFSNRRLRHDLVNLEELVTDLLEKRVPKKRDFFHRVCFGAIASDLERLASAQRDLRDQVDREDFNFRTILSSMQEGVMLVNAGHVIQLVNPSFLKLFDMKGDPIGSSVLAVLREPVFEEMVTAALKTGDPQASEVAVNGAKPLRHFSINAVAMRDSAGQEGVVMIFRDISRLKQLEDVRREFVANVSHELRTPLSIFHGYLETILDNPDLPREELTGILEIMRKHSLRLNALLEDLLILARLESRGERLHCERIELGDFAREIAADWSLQSSKKKIRVEVQIPADLPALEADALRLEQVLNNLIGNALKYTEPGGRVVVRAKVVEGQMEIQVEDDGVGIPPVDLPHIFERFYRADKARSREQGGTGLGLSIVKHIVQTHGGSVGATSTFGKGTTIILRLPLSTDPAL